MKKILLLGAGALLASTAANAGSGTFFDGDGSGNGVSYSSSTTGNFEDDANSSVTAQFTMTGTVDKTCSIMGVDGTNGVGLAGTVDLGTIGIVAGDDTPFNNLFTMSGPASVDLHSAAAGCNYNNSLTLTKSSADGLLNTNPGSYDSNQFQANIPYAATASFTGVQSGIGAGTSQSVTVDSSSSSNGGTFGAWRSPLDIHVAIPQVAGKGLVGGQYTGTLTVTLAIS
jgi:hypothetical protein